jgi:hypothetical protein
MIEQEYFINFRTRENSISYNCSYILNRQDTDRNYPSKTPNYLNFFFNLYSGRWNQGPLDTAATNGLLCQPRVIMMMEK